LTDTGLAATLPSGVQNDGDLFERWTRGDTTAGDELVRRYYWSVHRFFELKVPRAAEDLTQRTFLACTEARDRYARLSSFRGYLFGIARRQLLYHLRTRKSAEQCFDDGPSDAVGREPTPSGLVSMMEEQRVLLMALQGLPIYLQMTVQLHYWEGLKAHEVGEALGIPTSTVTSRLARARTLLSKTIRRYARPRPRESLLQDLDAWAASLAGRPLPQPFG
jgi:RNA polymerase sigma factor (sigma-70 family)